MSSQQAASALNRFGLGAKPGELRTLDDPRAWLLGQLTAQAEVLPPAFAGLPTSRDYLQREFAYNRERVAERRAQRADSPRDRAASPAADTTIKSDTAPGNAVAKFKMSFRDSFGKDLQAEIGARYRMATAAEAGFTERLVHFWSNHFAISADKRQATLYAAPMEREAARPFRGSAARCGNASRHAALP